MIKVSGMAKYEVDFELEIDMSEEKWDALSESKQKDIINSMIGRSEMESAEMDDCDVWEIEEFENEK